MNVNPKRNRVISPLLAWANANKKATDEAEKAFLSGERSIRHRSSDDLVFHVPAEFNGKDYITMLLHIDAEIEQGLMLQYLYAGYSIGGPQIPAQYKQMVHGWQNTILGVAKEEMGHFISVQNVLKVIGAPLNFGRESYPWDIPFYPFPFTLEKFTLASLAKYIYAEAPADWLSGGSCEAEEVIKLVNANVAAPHTVGALFKVLLQLIKKPDIISDDTFQPKTYPYQAKFDEWGRNYAGGNTSDNTGKEAHKQRPDVLVAPLLSRDDAYNALQEIAEQGEGEETTPTTTSHFQRFLAIFQEYKQILAETGGNFAPARDVATNPYTATDTVVATDSTNNNEPAIPLQSDIITNPEAVLWANLLDIRYRLLLNFINHSFLLDNGLNNPGSSGASGFSPRGMIINSAFGEMYNLRGLSTILVQTPIAVGSHKMAGPPFTSPYTYNLPAGEPNRWKMHEDLLIASNNIIKKLKAIPSQAHLQYLNGMREVDKKLLQTISTLTSDLA